MRNDAFSKDGVTAEQVVSEACRLARGYTATLTGRRGWRISTLPWYVLLLLGGLAISLLWLAVELI